MVAVNTNVQSLFAQRALMKNTMGLQKSIERLSTGFKINKAGDDAAGLTISEKFTSQVRGLEKATQNANDGISLIQTAEGALAVIQDNLQRIRELLVQGANGTNGTDELTALDNEITERMTTMNDIANATTFNGIKLLDGTGSATLKLQTGANNGQTTTLNMSGEFRTTTGNVAGDLNEDNTGTTASSAAAQALNVIDITDANANFAGALLGLDNAIDNVSSKRSTLGATQNSIESRVEYLQIARENLSAARSRIRDVDIASESSALVKNQILQQSASAMLSQANSAPQIALDLLP